MTFPIVTTVPAAGNNPSVDQGPMQQNFANISGFLSIDHTAPGSTGAGQHNQVTFTANEAAPSLGTGVAGIYVNLVSALSQLFFQNSSQNFQMTNLTFTTGVNGGTAGGTLNYFDTPWNIRFYMGLSSSVINGTVLFDGILGRPPPFTTLFYSTACIDSSNVHQISCQGFTTQLSLHNDSGGGVNMRWLAFGRL